MQVAGLPLPVPEARLPDASARVGPFVDAVQHRALKLGQQVQIVELSDDEAQPGGARDAARVRPPGTVITGRAPSLKSGSVSLLDIIEAGLLAPGKDNLTISYKGVTYTASLQRDGTIEWQGLTFQTASALGIHVKRLITPNKQGDDGWKSVQYRGKPLDFFRKQYQELTGVPAARSGGAKAAASGKAPAAPSEAPAAPAAAAAPAAGAGGAVPAAPSAAAAEAAEGRSLSLQQDDGTAGAAVIAPVEAAPARQGRRAQAKAQAVAQRLHDLDEAAGVEEEADGGSVGQPSPAAAPPGARRRAPGQQHPQQQQQQQPGAGPPPGSSAPGSGKRKAARAQQQQRGQQAEHPSPSAAEPMDVDGGDGGADVPPGGAVQQPPSQRQGQAAAAAAAAGVAAGSGVKVSARIAARMQQAGAQQAQEDPPVAAAPPAAKVGGGGGGAKRAKAPPVAAAAAGAAATPTARAGKGSAGTSRANKKARTPVRQPPAAALATTPGGHPLMIDGQLVVELPAGASALQPSDQWVQCDRCGVWRLVPNEWWQEVQDDDREEWFCEYAKWDLKKAVPHKPPCKLR